MYSEPFLTPICLPSKYRIRFLQPEVRCPGCKDLLGWLCTRNGDSAGNFAIGKHLTRRCKWTPHGICCTGLTGVARCAPFAREENPCACHASNSRGRRVQVGIHERSAEFAFFVCVFPLKRFDQTPSLRLACWFWLTAFDSARHTSNRCLCLFDTSKGEP